jgi:hypothetical protein
LELEVSESPVIENTPTKSKRTPQTPAQRQASYKARKRKLAEASSELFDSPLIASRADARKILIEDRRIKNLHVVETILELGEIAAQLNKLVTNKFFWRNGSIQSLESIAANKAVPMPETPDETITGELIGRADLYALWQFSQRRNPEVTFEDFLAVRRRSKEDCFYFGKEILGKDFHTAPHQAWFRFPSEVSTRLIKGGLFARRHETISRFGQRDQAKTARRIAQFLQIHSGPLLVGGSHYRGS